MKNFVVKVKDIAKTNGLDISKFDFTTIRGFKEFLEQVKDSDNKKNIKNEYEEYCAIKVQGITNARCYPNN